MARRSTQNIGGEFDAIVGQGLRGTEFVVEVRDDEEFVGGEVHGEVVELLGVVVPHPLLDDEV